MSNRTQQHEERLYTGSISEQLQRIYDDGLVAAPIVYVMSRRLECVVNNETVPEHVRLYVDMCDGIAEHPAGRVKYVHDCFVDGTWRDFGVFQDREFVLHDRAYEQIRGEEFLREVLVVNRDFFSAEAVDANNLWKTVCRHPDFIDEARAWDARLLYEYARRVVFPHFTQAMAAYLDSVPQKPRLRASFVDGLEGGSQFYGGYYLVGGCRRVFGVAPEALEDARLRSFEVCERASRMAYPALKSDEQRGASLAGLAAPAVAAVASTAVPRTSSSLPYASFLDPHAPPIPLEILSEKEAAERATEISGALETQQTQFVRGFEIYRKMKEDAKK